MNNTIEIEMMIRDYIGSRFFNLPLTLGMDTYLDVNKIYLSYADREKLYNELLTIQAIG